MTDLLTAREAARRLRLSVSQTYAMAARSELPVIRFGERAIRFPADELELWLAGKIERPSSPTA